MRINRQLPHGSISINLTNAILNAINLGERIHTVNYITLSSEKVKPNLK